MHSVGQEVTVTKGYHTGRTGKVEVVFPCQTLSCRDVYQVRFTPHFSGQFTEDQVRRK